MSLESLKYTRQRNSYEMVVDVSFSGNWLHGVYSGVIVNRTSQGEPSTNGDIIVQCRDLVYDPPVWYEGDWPHLDSPDYSQRVAELLSQRIEEEFSCLETFCDKLASASSIMDKMIATINKKIKEVTRQ